MLTLAIAILGNRPVILLDNLSNSLDHVSKLALWAIIEETIKDTGNTILITSHRLANINSKSKECIVSGYTFINNWYISVSLLIHC